MQNVENPDQAESQSPKGIALTIFRFRARRGLGVFYALFSILPLVVAVMSIAAVPVSVIQVSCVAAVLLVWLSARMAGMQRFHSMMMTIDVLDGRVAGEKPSRRLTKIVKDGLTTPILPLTVIAVFYVVGTNIYTVGVLIFWIGIASYSNFRAFSKRSKDYILQRRIEDWLTILTLPVLIALFVFGVKPAIALAVVAPVWLIAGIKSLYESPQSLYEELGGGDSIKTQTVTKAPDDRSLTELASAGVLSNNARVGILIALQVVERITFTDLLISLKLSKSSLSRSLKILEDAGYVTVHIGFKATGRPRTFIQITKEGKTAIRDHLETMRHVTKKYL